MDLFSRWAIVAIVLVAVAAGTQAVSREIPPLFRSNIENPNARVAIEPRAINYRLPNNTEPLTYDITLKTNVHTGDTHFTGVVAINLRVLQDTRTIVLHSRQQANFTAKIRSVLPQSVNQDMVWSYDESLEFLTLTTTGDLNLLADTEWVVTIEYGAFLRNDNGGFYLSTYTDDNGNKRYLATTQFESTDARHAFPCFDEPAKRAHFTITIHHDPSYNAISNMPVDSAKTTTGITAFQTSINMPTYLVGFIVSDFVWTEGVLDSLPQRVYSRPGTEVEQQFALVSGLLIVDSLSQYYAMPYDTPKLYQAAVPDFSAGAMENWGLVTYREEYLLYNKEDSTVSTQNEIARLIAHEYCHQWFGNRVAIKWWTYLWLKEGFATVFSYQAVDDVYPEWDYYQVFHANDFQSALNNDAVVSARPMTHYVQAPSEIEQAFSFASYAKAGRVLHMWQNAVTDAVYQQALRNYLTNNEYGSAEELDFFNAFQTAAKDMDYPIPETMLNMWPTWTRQAGYPLLNVTRDYSTGHFTVSQKAYFTDNTVTSDKSWYVPFNYAYKSNSDFRNTSATHYLLNVPEVTVTDNEVSSDDWLILNKQSTGYYRINYDEQNWHLIIDGITASPYKIHTLNRAQLLSDAYSLSSTGRLAHDILLSMMEYLQLETEYAPWSMANSIITTFNRYLSGDVDYTKFLAFVKTLVMPLYEKLGVNDHSGDHHLAKLTRAIAINIACLAGEETCLQEMNTKLSNFVNHGIVIEPNLRTQTFCNGLRQSGDNEFDFVYNLLMTSDDQALRRTLISALGCAQNVDHINKFISSSIDNSNGLRAQERITVLNPVYSRGEVGLLACIEFLDQDWEEYSQLPSGFGGINPLENDILGMANYVTNEVQKDKLLALVDKVKGSSAISSNLDTTVTARINANFDWLSRNRDPVMNWLNKLPTDDDNGDNDGDNGDNGDDGDDDGASSIAAASLFTVLMAASLVLTRWY